MLLLISINQQAALYYRYRSLDIAAYGRAGASSQTRVLRFKLRLRLTSSRGSSCELSYADALRRRRRCQLCTLHFVCERDGVSVCVSVYYTDRAREWASKLSAFTEAAALLHVRVCCCLAAARSTTECRSTCANSAMQKHSKKHSNANWAVLCSASASGLAERIVERARHVWRFLSDFLRELTSLLASIVAPVRGSNNNNTELVHLQSIQHACGL